MELCRRAAVVAFAAFLLAGCVAVPQDPPPPEVGASPWAQAAREDAAAPLPRRVAAWRHFKFPGKSPTRFTYARKDGRDAVAVLAASSASMLRGQIRLEPYELDRVNFSWKVPRLIEGADLALPDAADSPVRIVLVFEGDRTRFSPRDAMLSELMQAVTGEPMPYATLMYVWCNQREPGTVIKSSRTDRIRKLVVQSGPRQLDHWLDYERNI
ncbi:MAG TPA: DUF3047 domain-containing protein, partial [Ramlibacter sp.]|nr:DUF3047 domain-containing protein [Ramlibacter sp.]